MKSALNDQCGAVLIFSLVFLLLIVLASTTMVHQNRMQFMMVNNTQGQANEIAKAENVLRSAEKYIDSRRYEKGSLPDEAAGELYDCQTSGGFYNQLQPGSLTASDLGVELLNDSVVEITKTVCINSGTQMQELDCATDTTTCNQSTAAANPCDTELYTIAVTMRNSTNNERSVVSRYAIRCDN